MLTLKIHPGGRPLKLRPTAAFVIAVCLVTAATAAMTLSVHGQTGEPATAPANFHPAQTYWTVGNDPVDGAPGDLNGDGFTDFVTANIQGYIDTHVSVFLNAGDGTFLTPETYPAGAGTDTVDLADLNNDGKLDIAVLNYNSQDVSFLYNSGSGTFAPAGSVELGFDAGAMIVEDLSGDGSPDIAATSFRTNEIAVYINSGTGAFAAGTRIATALPPDELHAADLNQDGALDLATSHWDTANISVLLNQGGGAFGPAQQFATGTNPKPISSGDFNNDGAADLAVGNFTANSVSVLLNEGNGSGRLGSPRTYATGGEWTRGVTTADFNLDGLTDLATVNQYSKNLSVLVNTGSGFGQPLILPAAGNPFSIDAADVNNDAAPDLLSVDRAHEQLYVFLNAAEGPGEAENPGEPAMTVSPQALNFGRRPAGTASSPQNVSVTNTGQGNLKVTGLGTHSRDAADFTILSENCTARDVPPGGSCTVEVTFTPAHRGKAKGELTVASNAGAATVQLSGIGTR